ncbi:Trinucleotide repeat-containing gene 18 protein [Plecturocebus cupreus]
MAPAFPPSLEGSLPLAYQFVRDPQSHQLVVIPSDHMSHFAELMEQATTLSLWPALYPPGLQPSAPHPAVAALLTAALPIATGVLVPQQQAAPTLELQRSTQLVQEQLKAQDHQVKIREREQAGPEGHGQGWPGHHQPWAAASEAPWAQSTMSLLQ